MKRQGNDEEQGRFEKDYKFNNSKKGRYEAKGKKLKFKTGPMKGVYEKAVWSKSGKRSLINLFDEKSDRSPTVGCSRIRK